MPLARFRILPTSKTEISVSADPTDPALFDQNPTVLASLIGPKSLPSIEAMGGTEGLLRGLGTDANLGLGSWQYTGRHFVDFFNAMASQPALPTTAATDDPNKKEESSDESNDATPSVDPTNSTPFDQKPSVLGSLVDPKSLQGLEAMGGTEDLLRCLGTDANLGLRSWQYADSGQRRDLEEGEGGGAGARGDSLQPRATAAYRRRIYGVNQTPSRKSKSLWLWMWLTLKDKQLGFMSLAAVIELVLGLYFDSDTLPEGTLCDGGADKCAAPPVDWVEGAAIMITVLLIVVVGSFGDWQQERQFRELNNEKDDRGVKVIRDGQERAINDAAVCDIVLLEPGEVIGAKKVQEDWSPAINMARDLFPSGDTAHTWGEETV